MPRVGHEAVGVHQSEAHGLNLDVVAPRVLRPQVKPLQKVQGEEDRHPLAVWGKLPDGEPLVLRGKGRHPLRGVGLEVLPGKEPPRGLAEAEEGLGQGSPVKAFPVGPGDLPEGLGVEGASPHLSRPWGPPPGEEDLLEGPKLRPLQGEEDAFCPPPAPRRLRPHGEAFLGVTDCGDEDLGEGKPAPALVQGPPPRDRPRHGHGKPAPLRHPPGKPFRGEGHGAFPGGVQAVEGSVPHQGEEVPPDPVGGGLHHGEAGGHGNGGVHGASPLLEHLHPRQSGKGLARGHRAPPSQDHVAAGGVGVVGEVHASMLPLGGWRGRPSPRPRRIT